MIGTRVNNYEILSLLGEGGMGAVYLAEHPVMGRKAAVKFLRRELAEDKSLVVRFINEARAANAIRHPNIIEVIDVGTLPDHGLPYMMMELLEGESLAKRIGREKRLPVEQAVEIALQTASALGAAHAKGIVHRDLKPDNLFLVPDERDPTREQVKVLDFGIAKLRGELSGDGGGSVKTHAGSIMGTPPYMSPEQCRGINDEIDHRTDVYALGIILYEMLTGAPPFVSAGFGEVLVMHLTEPPVPPRQKNPELPAYVEAAVLRALAKTTDERFASMAALQAALGGRPLPALNAVAPLATSGGDPGVTFPTPRGPTMRARAIRTPAPMSVLEEQRRTTSTTFSTSNGELRAAAATAGKRRIWTRVLGAGLGLGVVLGAALTLRAGKHQPPARGPALTAPPSAPAPIAPKIVPAPMPAPSPEPAPPPPPEPPAPVAAPPPKAERERREPARKRPHRATAPPARPAAPAAPAPAPPAAPAATGTAAPVPPPIHQPAPKW